MHGIENEYKTQDDGWNTTRNVDCKTSCLRYLALQSTIATSNIMAMVNQCNWNFKMISNQTIALNKTSQSNYRERKTWALLTGDSGGGNLLAATAT